MDNISIGRNFLYRWIYSHHIVNYEQFLLNKIIGEIDSKNANFCDKFFSLDAFLDYVDHSGKKYYLPSDDDLMHIIKQYKTDIPEVDEFLSRDYKFRALWKTYFEFNFCIFNGISSENRLHIGTKLKNNKFNKKYVDKYRFIQCTPKLKSIKGGDFFIDIENSDPIDAVNASTSSNKNLDYFILYVSPDLLSQKEDIIKEMHKCCM